MQASCDFTSPLRAPLLYLHLLTWHNAYKRPLLGPNSFLPLKGRLLALRAESSCRPVCPMSIANRVLLARVPPSATPFGAVMFFRIARLIFIASYNFVRQIIAFVWSRPSTQECVFSVCSGTSPHPCAEHCFVVASLLWLNYSEKR